MISLTFDDGSQADYDYALPILNALGYKSTQYIPTAGLSPHSDPFLMTVAEIRTVAAQRASRSDRHSIDHPDLTTVDDAALKDELVKSKALLEDITGVASVVNFAYPFGATTIASSRRRRQRATDRAAPSKTATTPGSTWSPTTSATRTC